MNGGDTLILGAGFGGISTAVELARRTRDPSSIVLVDRQRRFVPGSRKTQHVIGAESMADASRDLGLLAAKHGIELRIGEVDRSRAGRKPGSPWLTSPADVG